MLGSLRCALAAECRDLTVSRFRSGSNVLGQVGPACQVQQLFTNRQHEQPGPSLPSLLQPNDTPSDPVGRVQSAQARSRSGSHQKHIGAVRPLPGSPGNF
ncbi:hypothetical protein NDU88_005700 [Pleurodeles waltl]|uniref:Uncharacterized protein n=1 Tax=Pleurodeles waltl TaxID=8319 RepID=A0AAV7UIY8_PLEWA|nr:hypothetical protein NDU88_005700 [Pleurodeles waltl]